jgi:hypothetical protein
VKEEPKILHDCGIESLTALIELFQSLFFQSQSNNFCINSSLLLLLLSHLNGLQQIVTAPVVSLF